MTNHPHRAARVGRTSKRKHPELDGWLIFVDGRDTGLHLVKGSPPRFREPQEYEVFLGDDLLLTAKSVSGALTSIDALAGVLTPPPPEAS